MPVMNTEMVKYDCNVSLTTEQFGPSATMIVELMDGYEEAPDLLQAHLVGAVIKRLKVVAHASPRNTITGREEYVLDISTERGYHLGRVKFAMPFATGWNGTSIDMNDRYLQSEAQGHIEIALRQHLNVRINQRTPPLPRKPANAKGISEDMVFSTLMDSREHFEETKRYVQRTISERMMAQREQELLQKQLYFGTVFPSGAMISPHDLFGVPAPAQPYPGGTDTAKAADVSTRMSRDVARRSDDSSRVDTATRGGTEGRDVAEMGVELDL
jgi:hypothetical protein